MWIFIQALKITNPLAVLDKDFSPQSVLWNSCPLRLLHSLKLKKRKMAPCCTTNGLEGLFWGVHFWLFYMPDYLLLGSAHYPSTAPTASSSARTTGSILNSSHRNWKCRLLNGIQQFYESSKLCFQTQNLPFCYTFICCEWCSLI